MPVTQYDGLTLIRQNVDLKCESDHPEYLETQAEVSDVEGFFCNIRFVGSSAVKHQDIQRKAKVTVTVASSRKRGAQTEGKYEKEVLSFEIKLVSNIYVEDSYRRGVSLGQYSRRRTISVLSLADFNITSGLDEQSLKVRRSRDPEHPNQYNVTLIVPSTSSQRFSTKLSIENLATGEVINLPVTFDPSDFRGKPSAAKEVDPQWATTPTTEPSETRAGHKPRFDTADKRPKDVKIATGGREQPAFVTFVIFLFIVCIGLFLAKDTVS